jgi:hypothetical protein
MLPAATATSIGFQRCVREFSTSVMCARPRRPRRSPSNKFQSRRAAAHDDDVAQRLVMQGLVGVRRRQLGQVVRQLITAVRLNLLHIG